MFMTKILERKEVIRFFGVSLILAPFLNTWMNMPSIPLDAPTEWIFKSFISVFMAGVLIQKILNVSSVVIGGILLSGSMMAWRFVLGLLGGYILMQLIYLGQNLRTNPITGFYFLINVVLFLFIADQLVWKQKNKNPQAKPEAKAPQPRPALAPELQRQTVKAPALKANPVQVKKSRAKIFVHFKDHGTWGQLSALSIQGIEVKSLGTVPANIEKRILDVRLSQELHLRARFAHKHGPHFYFEYQNMQASDKAKLAQWIRQKAA